MSSFLFFSFSLFHDCVLLIVWDFLLFIRVRLLSLFFLYELKKGFIGDCLHQYGEQSMGNSGTGVWGFHASDVGMVYLFILLIISISGETSSASGRGGEGLPFAKLRRKGKT